MPLGEIGRLLDALETQGLIERREDEGDRRAKAVHLTGDGRTLVEGIRGVAAEVRERLETALSLDPDVLAARLNAGVRETATRTTYKARDHVRAELIKQLERKNRPVPAALRDTDAPLSPEHAAEFLALKYPYLQDAPRRLETLYTDARFMDDLASNFHWRAPTSAGVDLARYAPELTPVASTPVASTPTASTPGLVGAIPGE